MKYFENMKRIRELEVEVRDLTEQRDAYALNNQQGYINSLEKQVEILSTSNTVMMKELAGLKETLRKQNTADLLLNALQSIGIVKDERTGIDYLAEAGRLEVQRLDLGQYQQAYRSGGGGWPYAGVFTSVFG